MTGRRKGGGGTGGARALSQRLRSARGRTPSQQRWLTRQLNDPYVREAKARGYRSRAAFKLVEIDGRFGLLKPGARVLDLGAAPGGWTQVAVERVGPQGAVLGVDIQEMEPVPGATLMQRDFLDPDAPEAVKAALGGPVDVVLSDMAAPATGHRPTDHLKIMALCEAALDFAETVLAPGGAFVAKVLKGGSERELLARMKMRFAQVAHFKPPASRRDSSEEYVVATGFRG